MHAIEFYTTPSGEVIIKEQGQPERQLKESDTDFIQRFLEVTPVTMEINAIGISWLYADLSNATSGCMTI